MNEVIKNRYTAAEIAEMRLPGMPATKVGVRTKAEREGWPFVSLTGAGGTRREYTPSRAVMESIREKAACSAVSHLPARRKPTAADQIPLIATDDQSLVADARKGVLLALETLMNRSGYSLKKAARVMLELAETGQAGEQLVAMLKKARDGRGRQGASNGLPSLRTLLRFVEYGRAGNLIPVRPGRDMTVPNWAPTFMECYQRPEKPTVAAAYRAFVELARERGFDTTPSQFQVEYFLRKVGKVSKEVGRMGEHELKNLRPFIRRDFRDLLPTDIYSADGHRFDAEVQHPIHGRPFRPEITSIIDIATRRLVGWSVGLAESALVVVDALRHASTKNGIPAIFYVDNGSGYKNHMMKDEATGLMGRLGTTMTHSLPYNSQAKGVIERSHQTIWVQAAKELPGYIGKDMDRQAALATFKLSRKAIKAKQTDEPQRMPLIGWEGFVEFCGQKVEAYNNRPHRSLGKITDPETGRKRHMSPNEAWAKAVANGFVAKTVTDDEVRPLFRPQELRKVIRCEVSLFGNRYFSRALEEFNGEQLRIAFEVQDASKVWVHADDGRLICTAELNGNLRPYAPKSFTEKAQDKRADGKLARLQTQIDEVYLERHGVPALENMDVVNIPGFLKINREDLAARAREAILVDAVTLPTEEMMAQPPAVECEPVSAEWTVPNTPQERYAEWKRLSEMKEEAIETELERKWRLTYQATAEFRMYNRKTA